MRKFNVTVNGEVFDVEVEELGQEEAVGGSRPAPVPIRTAPVSAPVSAPASAPAPAPKAAAAAAPKAKPVAANGGEIVKAPLPGSVLDVRVNKGAQVKPGTILCILEAMKMENEVLSPVAGTVEDIFVAKGQTVSTGEAMFLIK